MITNLINKYKKGIIGFFASLFLVGGGGAVATISNDNLGIDLPGARWVMFGDDTKFTGYQTKNDPSKVDDGANPQGQNTFINNGDRISIRDFGYELFPAGTASSSNSAINTTHTFRKRSGENIFMRTLANRVEVFDEAQDVWETLQITTTTGREFGFADYNINADLQSYVYFGNGVDQFARWTGNHTNLSSAAVGGAASIQVNSTAGFPSASTIIYCDQLISYSSITATEFNVGSAHSCDSGRAVMQAVEINQTNPRGNIYLVANNRLFIAGVASTTQAVFFSKYGDAMSFITQALVTDTTAEDSGIFNLGEGGGAVTALLQDENSIYMFKRTIIYRATLNDSLYTLTPLKPFDGKSQTTGAINQKSTFAGGNGIFFITPDNQIMNLTRVEGVDYPQIIPISDTIKPTVDIASFASSTGIFYKDKAYIAAKTNSNSLFNDVIFVYNFRRQAWESPIVGINASDWDIYDDNSGAGEKLYFGNAGSANVYKINNIPLDDIYGIAANWRSKQYDFGRPNAEKEIENIFVEGYITDNTNLTVSLLLDDNGFSQIYTTTVSGTESNFLFDSPSYNVFGLQAFGTERFGSNQDASGKKKFRLYLNKNLRRIPFYNVQIEFASDGENQQWEILRYGFYVRESSQPENRTLYRVFN